MHGPGVLKAVSLLLLLACVRATGQAMLLQPGQRVIVVGDVHGDIDALRDVLSMANVTDKTDEWVAQDDVLVQLGDLVDRGGFSDQCVDFMLGLQEKARKHGGEVVLLMGNHELLNLQGSNEYTAPEEVHRLGGDLQRSLLFSTRGSYGKRIVDNFQTMYINGASAFVHAGLNQEDAALGSHLLNEKVRKFLRNNTFEDELFADNGPFWTRQFVRSAQKGKCDYVTGVLSALSRAENRKIKYVFIGHTIQPHQEVHRYCGGRVIATDVGMSYGVGRGLLRRAVTVITRDEISTIHKGSAGDDGTSLMSQGAIVFPFIATIITPVVAVASAVAMIRATRNLRNRLDVSLRSLCHALSPWPAREGQGHNMQRFGALRCTRVVLGYYRPYVEDEASYKAQYMQMAHLPDKQLFMDKGTYIEPTTRLCINTDGSMDVRDYELYPADGPDLVVMPKDCDRHSWARDVARRRAIMSGIDVDQLAE